MTFWEGRWHVPIIVGAVQAAGGVYLEIGVRYGTCFNEAAQYADEAHAVDPVSQGDIHGTFWPMPSDMFFAQYDGTADTVFIDGDHSYEQARIDFRNALRVLSPDGTIFLHDTWPVTAGNLKDTGTVWRLAAELEGARDLNVFTYRRYPGLTVVQRPRIERFA